MRSNGWIDRAGCLFLRWSLAIVFGWFGALKLFDLCPLGGFISRSLPFVPSGPFLFTLGCWEVAIGVCMLVRPLVRVGLWLILFHLPGTFLPLIVIPGECFTQFPYGLTVAGQYIVKNLTLASAALVVAARSIPPSAPRSVPRRLEAAPAARPAARSTPRRVLAPLAGRFQQVRPSHA